jgi:hypothetical protein
MTFTLPAVPYCNRHRLVVAHHVSVTLPNRHGRLLKSPAGAGKGQFYLMAAAWILENGGLLARTSSNGINNSAANVLFG